MKEEYPGQLDEIRRDRLIKESIEAGDRIILRGSDGTVEELWYLTAQVAKGWAEKVAAAMTGHLLSKILEKRAKEL